MQQVIQATVYSFNDILLDKLYLFSALYKGNSIKHYGLVPQIVICCANWHKRLRKGSHVVQQPLVMARWALKQHDQGGEP